VANLTNQETVLKLRLLREEMAGLEAELSQVKRSLLFLGNFVRGKTIEDVWREAMWCCVRNGRDYTVKAGSYVGQIRRQLPYVSILIEEPWTRPLAVRTPEGCGIPAPTDEEKINSYFLKYIIGSDKAANEDYTYGMYISAQLPRAIELLNSSDGNTNQTTITVGEPNSIHQGDPPCLRVISFKVVAGQLQMTVYFRSWDLFSGLPENLGGLQLLKEYVLTHLVFPVEDGPIMAFSDGLHVYEQYFPLVNALNVDKIVIPEKE
jgi:thymidylate synthase